MRLVALEDEVLVLVVEDRLRRTREPHRRVRERRACRVLVQPKLPLHLLDVVVVDVAVAARPDEVARFEPGLLGDHHRQQRVAGDVERHSEEHVRGALVQLARQLAVDDVELEQRVAGSQSHLGQVRRVPGRNHHPARIRVALDLFDDLRDLVDLLARGRRPRPPLLAVHRAEVAVLVGPLVPDGNSTFVEPVGVGVAREQPQQLVHDRLQVHLLRRDEREPLRQVEADLTPEHAGRAGASAVVLVDAVGEDLPKQVFVRGRNRWNARHSVVDDNSTHYFSNEQGHVHYAPTSFSI